MEGRLVDEPNSCGEQWTAYIDYCFPNNEVRNQRCFDVFDAIGEENWDDIYPRDAQCLDVDPECYDPQSYDYYGTNFECI